MPGVETVGLEYVFNVGSAVAGSKKLSKAFQAIDAAVATTKQTAGRVTGAFKTMAGGIAGAAKSAVSLTTGFLGLDSIGSVLGKMSEMMPFLSDGFRVIGNVISRNLLWPLTQKLLPVFNQIIDWVRENRINFVKLGGVLVSVFNSAMSIGKTFIKVLQSGFNALWSAITGGAKITLGTFTKLLNFALFKITFMIQFVLLTIEPLVKAIGSLLGAIWSNAVLPFIEGFMEGFGGFAEPLKSLIDLLVDVADTIRSLFGQEAVSIFKFLGQLVGTQLRASFDFVLGAVRFLWNGIKALVSGAVAGFNEVMGDKKTGLQGLKEVLGIITGIVKFLWQNLFKPLFKLLIPGFKIVGRIIGFTVGNALKGIIALIKLMVRGFQFFSNLVTRAARAMGFLRRESRGAQGEIEEGAVRGPAQTPQQQARQAQEQEELQRINEQRARQRKPPLGIEEFRRRRRTGRSPLASAQTDRPMGRTASVIRIDDRRTYSINVNGVPELSREISELKRQMETDDVLEYRGRLNAAGLLT